MNCTICNRPVVLWPSAAERAKKCRSGYTAADYIALFPTHTECALTQRNKPIPWKPISEMPAIFQNEALLMLRQRVAKTFGIYAGTQQAADFVNSRNEAALLALL